MAHYRRTWRELGYALLGLPLAVAGLGYVVLTVLVGAVLSITLLGLPVLAGGLRGARGWAALHRGLARWAFGTAVTAPRPVRRSAGPLDWVKAALADRTGWRAVGYLLLKPPVAVLAAVLTVAFAGYGLFFVSFPFWWRFVRPVNYDSQGQPHRAALQLGDFFFDTWPRAVLLALIGVVLLLAGPWLLHGVLLLDRLLIRGLLGPTSLTGRVDDLERSRAYAVDDSAARLRRIERDLHDGAQARLVALAMKLGLVKEKLDGEAAPEVRRLVDTAHRDAKDAIVELRDLARGIHPPMLDNGLEPALATLARRGAVPVELRVDVTDRPAPAIETIAYFCVAELLTNVAKHSGAGRATVAVHRQGARLVLRVTDDGSGGARFGAGGGLAGLRDRVRTVDGDLEIDSRPGGPTMVTVDLPVRP
jgi:signal transduction histidine kinase